MHTKGIDSDQPSDASAHNTQAPAETERAAQSAIMVLLLSASHDGPWTRSEFELEMSATPLDVQDALAALQGSGLIHLHGELVIASHAAQHMDELDL